MYQLGKASERELQGVYPPHVSVVRLAIKITSQDFSVHDGIRTLAEQQIMVDSGASRTMNSMHLPQADGYSHATDLVPYLNGRLRWEWPLIYPIAEAMRAAGRQLDYAMRWGGAWNVKNFTLSTKPVDVLVKEYIAWFNEQYPDREPFVDGPHFESA